MTILSDVAALHIGQSEINFLETSQAQLFKPTDGQCAFVELEGRQALRVTVHDGRLARLTSITREPSPLRVERDVPKSANNGLDRVDGERERIEVTSGLRIGDDLLVRVAPHQPWRIWGTVAHISSCP